MRVKAEKWTAERTLTILDHLAETRDALERNVQPALAFESLLITVVTGRKP
jgi:DNA polymerase-3 subunit delta'